MTEQELVKLLVEGDEPITPNAYKAASAMGRRAMNKANAILAKRKALGH
jgi:hypothetical protein